MLKLLKRIRFLFVCIICSHLPICYAQVPGLLKPRYDWGRGLTIPQANLNLGGYVHIAYDSPENQSSHLTLDDLSLFVSWSPFDRLHFFSEIELEDFISTKEISTLNQSLSLERYYFDYLIPNNAFIRIGKFLTPVGIWNVNHAAPLVWTTTRPIITEDRVFASHASGLMYNKFFYFDDFDMNWSIYMDDSYDLDPRKSHFRNFKNALGTRFQFTPDEELTLGLSYLTYKNQADFHHERNHLVALDGMLNHNGYELQFEFIYRHAAGNNSEKGLYLQGVAPLWRQVYFVTRYEYASGKHLVDNIAVESSTHLGIAGLAWRPYAPLIFKAEYRIGQENEVIAPSGFFTSISMFY